MTVAELLATVSANLSEDFRYLISEYLSCSKVALSLMQDRKLSAEDLQILSGWFLRLRAGEPPQYICGKAWFYGLPYSLSPAVLIPRQDTEILVERVAARLQGNEQVLDIGTGSGIIAITLARMFPKLIVHATDIDPKALQVARNNAIELDTIVHFHKADLYPESELCFDVIVSNPPYISSDAYVALEPRVKACEPRGALWGGEDGMHFYRRILAGAERYLAPMGWIAMEHGYDQHSALADLAAEAGFEVLECGQDLAGRDRYMILTRRNSRG